MRSVPALLRDFSSQRQKAPARGLRSAGHGDPAGQGSRHGVHLHPPAGPAAGGAGGSGLAGPPAMPAGGRLSGPPLPGTTHLRGTGAAGGGASSRRRSGSPCCRLFPCSRCQTAGAAAPAAALPPCRRPPRLPLPPRLGSPHLRRHFVSPCCTKRESDMTLITAQWSLIKTLPTPAPRPPAPAIGPSCARRSTLTGRGPASINRPHRPCSAQQPACLSHWKAGRVNHEARPFLHAQPRLPVRKGGAGDCYWLPPPPQTRTARPAHLTAGPQTPPIGHPRQAEARALACSPSRWLPLLSVWSRPASLPSPTRHRPTRS